MELGIPLFIKVIEATVMYGIVHLNWWVLKKLFTRTERQVAILQHYTNRARKHGHQAEKPTTCSEGLCALF
jgi:hypothetical protein